MKFATLILSLALVLAANPSHAASASSEANALVAQSLKLHKAKNYTAAKQLAMQALALEPNNINALILLGDIEYMRNNMSAALSNWQRVAKIMPQHPQIKQRLAKIQREADSEAGMLRQQSLYFNITMDPKLRNATDFDVEAALNKARLNISKDFGYRQKGRIPVVIYDFLQFQEAMPTLPHGADGAYDGKIRVLLSENRKNYERVESIIIHEYMHAVVADLSKNNCPRWFNEGLAEYAEYRYGLAPRIDILALAYNTDSFIAWDKINAAFRSGNPSELALAYQQSFSFVQYLAKRNGLLRLRMLLQNLAKNPNFEESFKETYKVELSTLQRNWRFWLAEYLIEWAQS